MLLADSGLGNYRPARVKGNRKIFGQLNRTFCEWKYL